MNYPESVRFLYSLGNEVKTAKLGLERMQKLIAALGHPDRAFRSVHVAGTNGKGSTSAMIAAGLGASGLRTGLYTSPHLIQPFERVRINGAVVGEAEFAAAFDVVHSAAEQLLAGGEIDLHPTYFETVTTMAFVLFRDAGVHTAVIEVGLGGRLDATNVILPDLTVITPVDFDHEQYLGNTIESIAREKAGILKPRTPAIFGRQRAEAARVLETHAQEIEVTYQRVADCSLEDVELHSRGSRFRLLGERVECPLAGEHQMDNAVAAALALRELGAPREGIAATVWPGRLEWVSEQPAIILDGAHNPAGARALAAYIQRFLEGRRVWLIYGTMRDKAVDEVVSTLFPLASRIIVTAPKYERAIDPSTICRMWPEADLQVAPDPAAALGIARAGAGPEDAIFVTGSLFLVGEARGLLLE